MVYVDFKELKEFCDQHADIISQIARVYPSMTETEIVLGALKQGLRFEVDIMDMMEREGARADIKESLGRD